VSSGICQPKMRKLPSLKARPERAIPKWIAEFFTLFSACRHPSLDLQSSFWTHHRMLHGMFSSFLFSITLESVARWLFSHCRPCCCAEQISGLSRAGIRVNWDLQQPLHISLSHLTACIYCSVEAATILLVSTWNSGNQHEPRLQASSNPCAWSGVVRKRKRDPLARDCSSSSLPIDKEYQGNHMRPSHCVRPCQANGHAPQLFKTRFEIFRFKS
jgi:hypothetical protein